MDVDFSMCNREVVRAVNEDGLDIVEVNIAYVGDEIIASNDRLDGFIKRVS